jgi:hypothetical protein
MLLRIYCVVFVMCSDCWTLRDYYRSPIKNHSARKHQEYTSSKWSIHSPSCHNDSCQMLPTSRLFWMDSSVSHWMPESADVSTGVYRANTHTQIPSSNYSASLSDKREKMVHFKSIKMGSYLRHSKNLGETQKFIYWNFGFPRIPRMPKSWPGIEDWIWQLLVRVGLVLVQMSAA